MSISNWFEGFNKNLYISTENVGKISYRYERITKQLNYTFWNSSSEKLHSLYVGSYGRDTDIHVSDIDIIFELPKAMYNQYDAYWTNGQSALLQVVRNSILNTYPSTIIRADGQVVVVSFGDQIKFEIVPVFLNSAGGYDYPDTNNGGSWKVMNPRIEIAEVYAANTRWNKNYKRLCRMTRAWKDRWDVNIKGILIDTLAYHFMKQWLYKDKSFLYYDLMARDFFQYLHTTQHNAIGWEIPGSKVTIYRDGIYTSKASQAYERAVMAISQYNDGYTSSAKGLWTDIYGNRF